jgi:hypothetical protein
MEVSVSATRTTSPTFTVEKKLESGKKLAITGATLPSKCIGVKTGSHCSGWTIPASGLYLNVGLNGGIADLTLDISLSLCAGEKCDTDLVSGLTMLPFTVVPQVGPMNWGTCGGGTGGGGTSGGSTSGGGASGGGTSGGGTSGGGTSGGGTSGGGTSGGGTSGGGSAAQTGGGGAASQSQTAAAADAEADSASNPAGAVVGSLFAVGLLAGLFVKRDLVAERYWDMHWRLQQNRHTGRRGSTYGERVYMEAGVELHETDAEGYVGL